MNGAREAASPSAVLEQPDAVGFVRYLLGAHARTTLAYLAASSAPPPPGLAGLAIAVDAEWLDAAGLDWSDTVALCVLESADAPGAVLGALAEIVRRGAIVVLTARACADENAWRDALRAAGAQPAFVGRTLADNFLRERSTALAVLDAKLAALLADPPPPPSPRPLAVIATYNDADVVAQLARRHLDDGLDLHFVDNWSSDATHAILLELARAHGGRVTVERWPAGGPVEEYRWTELLERKAEIGSRHPGRWIVHIDSDELWRSPFPELSLAQAFAVAERYGANAVAASMFTFAPTRDGFGAHDDPLAFFTRFMYPPHDAYDELLRAWRQPAHAIDLSSSGGHEAKFAPRAIFPYRFPLFHYPFRSEEQGCRKLYRDRLPRFVQAERDRGWHVHFTEMSDRERFVGLPELLHAFDERTFHSSYLLERVSDAVIRRRRGSLVG